LVVGRVVQCGAIPGRKGHCYLHYHAVVSAFDTQHRLVAKERITNAQFSFLLRPGRYRLEAQAYGQAGAARNVTARANRTVHTVLAFAEP
jgi:hypothetical protein